MTLFKLLSEYRWPIYLGGLLTMSITSSGIIAWVATRPDTPRPMTGYYEAARSWDATAAVDEASRQLGWSVRYQFAADVPHVVGMLRPIDVDVTDRDGKPVLGLAGHLFAIRSSDARLNQSGALTAMPQTQGRYRTMIRIDAPGAWELRIDVTQAALRFVHAAVLMAPTDAAASQEGTRR
ncbi:MAG: FixH family protein [Acidobacteriota bacterium]